MIRIDAQWPEAASCKIHSLTKYIADEESTRACARIRRSIGLAPPGDVVYDELHEVLVAIADDHVFDGVCRRFAWPWSLARRPVALKPRPRNRDPVAKPLAGIREVSMPAERG